MLINMVFLALAVPAPAPAAPPPPPVVRTAPLPTPSGYRSMFVKWNALSEQSRAAEAATRPQAGAQPSPVAAAALGDRVGEMVATGNCRGGEQMALDAGDLALARAVRDHCNAPVAQ
jgi:hypothetical protein